MRSIFHQPDNKEILHNNVLIIYFLGHAQNLSNGNDKVFLSKALILKFNSFWLYEVLFPSCQLKCWEAMFCCLFITHFLNRLCSNPTPLLFLFLDAKAQTSLFTDFINFFPTSISPDIKDKAHFPRCEIRFHPSFWGVPTDVIKDSVDSVVPRRPLWTSNPPPLLPPTRSCLRTTFPQILNPFVSTSHLLHTALILLQVAPKNV